MDLDYYKILGVGSGASAADIKKRYKQLAVKYHPDKNEGDALSEEVFKKINEAYKILSDQKLRSQYDNLLSQHSASQENYTQRKQTAQAKKADNRKYNIISIVGFLIFAVIIIALYPLVNQWSSNQKYKEAANYAENSNWNAALVAIEESLIQWEENGLSYRLRARINASVLDNYTDALNDYFKAQDFLPEDSITGMDYYIIAQSYQGLGDVQKMCEYLKISNNKGFKQAKEGLDRFCSDY